MEEIHKYGIRCWDLHMRGLIELSFRLEFVIFTSSVGTAPSLRDMVRV